MLGMSIGMFCGYRQSHLDAYLDGQLDTRRRASVWRSTLDAAKPVTLSIFTGAT